MVVLEGYKEERISEAIAEWELLLVVLGLGMRMPSIVAEPPLGWEIEMVGARVPVGIRVLGEEEVGGGVRGEGTGGPMGVAIGVATGVATGVDTGVFAYVVT